jgi:drug/metabolite transporter (DMT)-like permease
MSFIYLLLVVLGITSVAYLAKLSAKDGVSSLDLTFVMFAAAGVLGYFFTLVNHVETASYTLELCSISAMAGIGGGLAVFVFNKSVRIGHFGYSNAIYRSSFLIPVIFSVAFFGATLNFVTVAGILCILTSILLVSWSNDTFAADRTPGNLLWFFMIIGAFALSGLPRIGQLLISHQNLNSFAYLFMSYAVGFILLLVLFAMRRKRLKARALVYGILAAFASYVGVYCTLEALKLMPAAVVFPITLSAPIMLGMFISFVSREKIRPAGWIGVLIGICGITMLALQTYTK